jgi:hypothetical protein
LPLYQAGQIAPVFRDFSPRQLGFQVVSLFGFPFCLCGHAPK